MSEEAPTPENPVPTAPTPEAPKPGGTPAASPAEETTDWKAEATKWEKRAKLVFKEEDADALINDAKEWRKHQDSLKPEAERREARERELEQRATAAETKLLRADVADAKKVPAEWRKFLTGTTQEELEASADEILALIPASKGSPPDPNQGQPAGEPAGDFLRNAARH